MEQGGRYMRRCSRCKQPAIANRIANRARVGQDGSNFKRTDDFGAGMHPTAPAPEISAKGPPERPDATEGSCGRARGVTAQWQMLGPAIGFSTRWLARSA